MLLLALAWPALEAELPFDAQKDRQHPTARKTESIVASSTTRPAGRDAPAGLGFGARSPHFQVHVERVHVHATWKMVDERIIATGTAARKKQRMGRMAPRFLAFLSTDFHLRQRMRALRFSVLSALAVVAVVSRGTCTVPVQEACMYMYDASVS